MSETLDFPEQQKLPTGLNVLTILTFIGSGLGLIMTLAIGPLYKFLLGVMDKALASGQELSEKEIRDIQKGKEAMNLVLANLTPIMITGLIGIILCIIGAISMRKLKKDGFWIYTAGELMPPIAGLVIIGTSQLQGFWAIFSTVIIPVLFVVLYATQKKYLIK